MGSPFNNDLLPEDCLLTIFQNLQNTADRNSFGLTCRRWLNVQNITRRSLIFQFSYDPDIYELYAHWLPKLLARFPHLSSISLAGCTELPDSALVSLRSSGLNLESLSLYCCFGITDHGIALISVGCPNLTSLTLYRSNITDVGLGRLAKNCRVLENVSLAYCILISDRGLNTLCKECPKLHVLMISYCKGITGTGLAGSCPSLTYLEADSCALTEEGLSGAASAGSLEYLNVSSLRNWLGADALGVIGRGSVSRLRFLNLRMCRFVGDDTVVSIANGCPLLEEWSLAVCHEVRLHGWSVIGSSCKNLRILHVNRCRNLCDQGLQAVAGCSQLSVLYMHGCRRVSCMGLELFKIARQDVDVRKEECANIGPSIDGLFA